MSSSLRRTLQVVGVRVAAAKAGKVVKRLQGHLLDLPRLRNVVPDPARTDMKLVLLKAEAKDENALKPLRGGWRSSCALGASALCPMQCKSSVAKMQHRARQ